MGKRKTAVCDSGESTSVDGSGSGSRGVSCVSTPSEAPSRAASPPDALLPTGLDPVLLKVCEAELPVCPAMKKPRLSADERISRIAKAARTILECLDDDPDREGLQKTPIRFAKSLLDLTSGYQITPEDVLGDAEFDENHTETVLVRNIDVFSHCEHHLLPFHGRCHVSYIPNGSVIGLSKIARIVDLYSHRLQVQERLTTQIADAVMCATGASGVMVHVSCTHMCMVMRGVQKVGADTVTTAARGSYKENPVLRQEFLTLISGSSRNT